jgi:ABC-2 type transport system permease protein
VKVLVIAATNLRRFLRDRSNIFFVFVFPILLILVLGASFGGTVVPRLGVLSHDSGELAVDLTQRLDASSDIRITTFDDRPAMVRAVERGELEAGVVIPAGFDATIRAGATADLEFVESTGDTAMRTTVESIVTQQATVLQAAHFATSEGVAGFADGLATATALQTQIPQIDVTVSTSGETFALARLGQFDSSAQTQLLLFMFLTSATASAALIQTRRYGVAHRMISTPTTARTVLIGEGLGRYVVALVQGTFIMAGTWLLFGVDWGDPVGAVAVLVVFALVGSGAAMLMGALFSNDQQASGLGVLLGMGLAALGGCMVPLQVFKWISPGLYRVAHITPHAWAMEAFDHMVLDNAGLAGILPYLAILLGYAVVLYGVASWRLRRVLTH